MINEIEKCVECSICLDTCPTYQETNNLSFSPMGRLQEARKIFNGEEITELIIESMYNCPECSMCEVVCPESIKITTVISKAREKLVEEGHAPLGRQEKIMKGIWKLGNSVRGDPEKRLDWLPEPFEEKKSENLLFLGCLPSYLVKDVARSSYLALKKANYDFMILEDEGCCGVYFFDAGKIDDAEKKFKENVARFEKLGIKKIIVPCAGCFRCFKFYYPEVLGKTSFEVLHISEILADEIKKGNLKVDKEKLDLVYHDPCRLGRKAGIYEEPREIIKAKGINLIELERNRENSSCCGAGAGIRSLYKDLSQNIASTYLKKLPDKDLVTSCSFCLFNFRAAAKKNDLNKKIKHISEIVL
ncbi:MAG: (Fe-S)-binding protein [Candidatus Helarchaeota archaeon]